MLVSFQDTVVLQNRNFLGGGTYVHTQVCNEDTLNLTKQKIMGVVMQVTHKDIIVLLY